MSGVTWAHTLTREVARYAAKARQATATRDDAIRRAHAEGISLRAIAVAAGISHTQVANICRAS